MYVLIIMVSLGGTMVNIPIDHDTLQTTTLDDCRRLGVKVIAGDIALPPWSDVSHIAGFICKREN